MKKEISFKNNKGQTLRGDLYVPEEKYKLKYPAVIICHGFTGNKDQENIIKLSKELEKNNYLVFTFDFHGHGKSEGKFEDVTVSQAASEIQSAIDSLYSLTKVDKKRVCVIGHSMGGSAALIAASRDSRIKALVTIGASCDRKKTVKTVIGPKWFKKWKKQGYAEVKGQKINYSFWEDTIKHNFLHYLRKIKIPFLVIHQEKDAIVGLYQSETIAKEAKAELKISSGEMHSFGPEAIKLAVNWLNKNLR